MPEPDRRYPHLLVLDRTEARDFNRQGGGDRKIRDVERRAHGAQIQQDAATALAEQDRHRHPPGLEELEALGVVITIEGARGYPLKLHSLDRSSRHQAGPRPKWLLLSVTPETENTPEQALVWVSDDYREEFLYLFEDYLTKLAPGSEHPRNRELVANMSRIRAGVLRTFGNRTEIRRRQVCVGGSCGCDLLKMLSSLSNGSLPPQVYVWRRVGCDSTPATLCGFRHTGATC